MTINSGYILNIHDISSAIGVLKKKIFKPKTASRYFKKIK
jgi:hypothetical protein